MRWTGLTKKTTIRATKGLVSKNIIGLQRGSNFKKLNNTYYIKPEAEWRLTVNGKEDISSTGLGVNLAPKSVEKSYPNNIKKKTNPKKSIESYSNFSVVEELRGRPLLDKFLSKIPSGLQAEWIERYADPSKIQMVLFSVSQQLDVQWPKPTVVEIEDAFCQALKYEFNAVQYKISDLLATALGRGPTVLNLKKEGAE